MERQTKIRVLICDDFPLILEMIRRFLEDEPSIEVVGMAEDGVQAVAKALDLDPDVVLMDIQMPRLNGVEATRLINEARKNTKVLILTAETEREVLVRCMDAGASGYLAKGASPHELIQAIEVVHRGAPSLATAAAR
jgi:two-component system, NarL family, nitrate/nitrite response regulator NarL